MECFVDDTMNSNTVPGCSFCGLEPSSSRSTPSDNLDQRENCRNSLDNNNPLAHTSLDIVPQADFTRPRCCSCVETSPTSPLSDRCPGLPVALDIPVTRPRSGSSPSQHSLGSHSSALHVHSSPDTVWQNPPHDSVQTFCIRCSSAHNSRGHSKSPRDQQPSASVNPNPDSPDKNLSSLQSETMCIKEGTNQSVPFSCPDCEVLSADESNDSRKNAVSSGNINTQCNSSDIEMSMFASRIPSTLTSSTSMDIRTDEPQTQISPWTRRLRGLVTTTDEDKSQKTLTGFKQYPDWPTAVRNPTSKDECKSSVACPTFSQATDRFTEVSRIATRRTPQLAKSSRLVRRELRLGVAPSRPTRHSLHSTSDLPMIITPDSPLPCLPTELLYQLHDLDHENEDLSAEVVYSLHFRDYLIKELLGKGISSTVRRVTEKSTGTEFAVKIIDISGEKGEPSQVDQIKKDTFREIHILRMCAGHPNIIELHDVFETPTFIFLVFEICRKGELFDYLTSVVSLSEKRTRIFMRQLIEAVAYIHDKNIVHRDLKPENILLDDNLNIKVSDFGFATVIEPGEELTELCGTPGYLAPEVLAHSMYENVSGYGKEVDMWACGVIMYTLLCGAPPFWNRRQMMMLRAIMNAEYTFNSPEWDDITEAPKSLIRKLLVVNPKDRLTAREALKHPFFRSQVAEEKLFHARRKFKAAVTSVMFYLRLEFFYKHPPPISVDMLHNNPYGIKLMRKVIDTCAFSMYKHWVKRVDNQNRAALFEHTLRDDWKHTPMIIDGVRL